MQAEFKQGSPLVVCIALGVVCLLLGVCFLVVKPLIGALILVLGVGTAVLIYLFSTTYVIRCSDAGFIVDSGNKRGASKHAEYKWPDITKTQYEEFESTDTENNTTSVTARYYSVFCGQERVFRVGKLKGFKDLIALVNRMAPQVPYTWEHRTGFNIQIGMISAGRSEYVAVPRQPAAGQAVATPASSQPPPLPPA